MRKLLLFLLTFLTASVATAQKVTLDFKSNDAWNLPTDKTVTATEYSDGTYSITLTGTSDAGFYFNSKDKYLMLGKQGATLQFPAFDFAVGKIVITGRTAASAKVETNIYVGENAVSEKVTGMQGTCTYNISSAYQAAGNVYVLKVLSTHNAQITKIEIYESGDEGGGDTPNPKEDISNNPESAYTVGQAINFISNKETYDLSKEVYVAGTVTENCLVEPNFGNATYDITDGTGATLNIFRGKYLKNKSFFNEDLLQDGDEVIVYGKLEVVSNSEDNTTTYRMASGNYLYSINDETEPEEEPEVEAKTVTIAEFNQAAVSNTVWYQLTGTVKNLQSGDQYGNFDLQDETGSVYVYGLLSEKGGEKKKFQTLVQEKGIVNGCTLTLIGNRGAYGDKIEVMNAFFVSVVAPEMPTETITVAEAQSAADGTIVSVQGTVYALCSVGAVLGDETGYIYYYNTNIADMKWNIGDQGTISGALSAYGGFNQFSGDAQVQYLGHTDVTYPTPVELDVDAWVAQPTIQYVTLTGTLNINNNRYNLVVDGKTAQGSVVGAMSDMFTGIESGATVTVEGFAMYTTTSTSTNTTYANIIATKVTSNGEGGGGEEGGGDNPDPVIDGDNLLTNGSFENWNSDEEPTDWKSSNSASSNATMAKSTDAHSGNYAVEIKSTASTNKRLASKEIALEAGTYTFSIWMKSAGDASVAKMGYAYMDGTSIKYVYFMGDDNKEIEYSITPEYTEYTGTFTLETATTVNLVVMNNKKSKAVSIIADDASLKKTEGGGGTDQKEDITNEATAPYTVSQAINFIDNKDTYDLSKVVYVMGEVAEVTEVSTDHGNATYTITDGNNTITIYRGKYLENKNFTNADQIQDGDEVIVYGKLTLYQKEGEESQYQMAQGNYLYSLNGKTEAEEETVTTITIAEAQALAANSNAAISATVYAVCKTGAVFGDETGYIYYYNTAISGLAVGDKVVISGTLSKYQGFNQFTKTADITKEGDPVSIVYPEAVAIDLDEWAAQPVIQYVTVTGELNISGNYYNLIVDGKTAQGSIVGAQDNLFANVSNGSTITVEGFAMYTSSNGKYVNIVATKVTVDEVVEKTDISNTADEPWSVAKACEFIADPDTYDLSKLVYVKGVITEIVSLDVTKWKRAQYDIADDANSETKLRIFNGYFLEGKDFTRNDQIQVNDEVVVYGQLTLFTPAEGDPICEMAQNNFIYSLNGEMTDGIRSIDNGNLTTDNVLYDLSGRRVEKATKGLYIVNGKKVVIK